ncbi:MAG: carbohydrate kinase [Lachnospiraceae bacterium]|nr:carbohydrate kinase [Lachnospiraceae bacterium]
MSVLCIGQCGYDMIYCIPGRIEENIKARVSEKYELPGGPAACASALTGKWGLETRLVTHVGDDLFADAIVRGLEKFAVDVSYVKRFAGTESSRSFVLRHSDNGNRTAFNYPGTAMDPDLPLPPEWDVLLIDSHEKSASYKALAANPSAVSILDGGTAREHTVALARKVDYLVCSEVFAAGFTGETLALEDPRRLAAQYRRLAELAPQTVVTLGGRGLLYRQGTTLLRMPAFRVECVDTLGAGDIFHGAFAYGLHQKLSFEQTLKISTAASGLSVTKIGGMSSIPERKDVFAYLKEHETEIEPIKAAEL